MKKHPGIFIIAAFFLTNGVYGLSQLTSLIIKDNLQQQFISPLIYNVGFLVAGIGLFWRQGWGRNCALLFNGFTVIVGLQYFLLYFYGDEPDTRSIAKGLVDLLIAGLIYFYLFKTKIKELFPESHVSWCILGLLLMLYGINQDNRNIVIHTFWSIITIVGLAISGYGARQLRKSVHQNPIFMNRNI